MDTRATMYVVLLAVLLAQNAMPSYVQEYNQNEQYYQQQEMQQQINNARDDAEIANLRAINNQIQTDNLQEGIELKQQFEDPR